MRSGKPSSEAMPQRLLHFCDVMVTDSGGLQKEAYFHQKPCLVVRPQTEWVELVEHGFALLVQADSEQITVSFEQVLGQELNFDLNFYGINPGETIYEEVKRFLD